MKMPEKHLYDTRFFVEYFYSTDTKLVSQLKEELKSAKGKMVSVITIHEMYRFDTKYEGEEVAKLRSKIIRTACMVVGVNFETAIQSAQLRSSHQMPMADSIIAITTLTHDCMLISDDIHFKGIPKLKTKWFR
jgi:PIN domain nuclease of toxin-antitoxin system